MSFSYPEGYRYSFWSHKYGQWWVNKESSYYLLAAQGFLGIDGSTLNVGCLYEIYRTFYPFLLRIFWFLEPAEALLMLDITLWFLACLSIWKVCQNLKLEKATSFFAVFFTIFAQGFLQSTGEGMPHLAGYVSGYFIFFLLSHFKTWGKETPWQKDFALYAFIGIWQMAYGTALFFLPFAVVATAYRFYQQSQYQWQKAFVFIFLSLAPYLAVSFCVKLFFKNSGGVANIVFEHIGKGYTGVIALLQQYSFVLMDSFIALGPVAFLGIAGLLYKSIKDKDPIFQVITIFCVLQFLVMAFLLIPLAGRGYATFSFYPSLCLGAAVLCGHLWKSQTIVKRSIISIFCIFWIYYTNAAKLGFILPSQIFYTGIANISQSWWGYELQFFE